MTSYCKDNDCLNLSLRLSPQLEGRLRLGTTCYMELQYPGEVILAFRWNDARGKGLTEDWYLHIVLPTSRRRSFTATMWEALIVVCVPAQGGLGQRHGLDRDLRFIAEAKGLYTVGRQAYSSARRSTMEQFDFIPELGPAMGDEPLHQSEQLNTSINMCTGFEKDVDPQDLPNCSCYGLLPSDGAPYTEVEALVIDIGQPVQEQNRRLRRNVIQEIWDEHVVDKMIKIVQMTDLDPLANALSPQVRAFLGSR